MVLSIRRLIDFLLTALTQSVLSVVLSVFGVDNQSICLFQSEWQSVVTHFCTLQSHKESWGKERLIKAFFLCLEIPVAFVLATEEEVVFPSQEKVLHNLLCWSCFEKQWWTRWYPEVPSYLTHSLPTSRTDQSRTRISLNKNQSGTWEIQSKTPVYCL